ncbi:MAG TPA: hypothetical protein VME18_10975 [Acidobacteriaceae bacterium]|nr:hypothetical protein [Acidobacteriaceae bacterium]
MAFHVPSLALGEAGFGSFRLALRASVGVTPLQEAACGFGA